MAVLAVDYAIMAVAGSIWLLLFRPDQSQAWRAATHSTALAYMADITDGSKRAQNFGLISAGFGMGFIFGPALGGMLAGSIRARPFVAAACLAALNFAFGYFVLPESLPKARRPPPSTGKRANPAGALKAVGRLPGVAAAP